jgi:hypothetical protein
MAEQTVQIKIQVDSKTGQISLKTMEKGFEKITLTAKQAEQAAKQLNTTVSKLTSSGNISATANSYQKLGTAISGTTAASGTATASVLELGRTISDAPYGIRGMANNLSQLASMFALSAKKAGGLGGALKAMGGVLMGPLGILLAFQTAIAIIEAFANSSNKLNKDLKELQAEGITTNVAKLHLLREAMHDSTIATEDKILALRKAATEFDELNGFIDQGKVNLDAFTVAITGMINRMKEVAFAKAILKETEEVMQDFVKAAVKGPEGMGDSFKGFGNGLLDIASGLRVGTNASKQFANGLGDMEKVYSKLYEMLQAKQGDGSGILLEHLFGKERKSGSGSGNKRFNDQLLDLSAMILKFYRQEAIMAEDNEREKLNLKQKYEKDDLVRRRDNFIAKQRERLKDFLAGKVTNKQAAAAKATLRQMELQAEEEYQEALTAKTLLHTTQRQVFQLELMRKFNEDMMNNRLQMATDNESMLRAFTDGTDAGMLNKPQSLVGAEDIERQQEAALARREAEQENFEADLEQKLVNLQNEGYTLLEAEQLVQADRNEFHMEQMQFELQLERDKIDAKRNINLEYISWVAGTGSILKGLAGDNEALATAALILEKGAAIASIVVKTQSANASITAATNESSQEATATGIAASTKGAVMLAGGNPQGAALVAAGKASLASAAGIQASGAARITKNKIGAGISIAAIAAAAIGQSSMGGSGGGGGGGGGGGSAPSRNFDFNLVGSTGVNQLAQGVGAQFQQPVQAYVVSSQMTSQQQLDTVIQTTAALGD